MQIDAAAVFAEATAKASGQEAPQETEVVETEEAEETVVEETESAAPLSWAEAIQKAPPEVAALMKSMQADYTRKTQDLANQRKAILAEREAWKKAPRVAPPAEELPEYDPWDASTVDARIEREVAARLQAMLEPVRAEHEAAAAEEAYQSFQESNPEFTTDMELRSEVAQVLQANESLDLETAFWMVKGKRAAREAKVAFQTKTASREANRRAATVTGPARRPGPVAAPKKADLKKMSSQDILALAQSMNGNR
jgi:hypothetical protein